jgi:predicted nicotinamide N-methyase
MVCIEKGKLVPVHRINYNMFAMRTISVKYPTIMQQRKIGNRIFVVEAIRDLDEAINLVCEAMTPDEHYDPFAEDLCPYFGILWESSVGLSQYLASHPELIKNKQVLELGCGLGLPSMVASSLGGRVLATDFHPDVEEYFKRNCRHSGLECSYQRLNWREEGEGQFDVVLGSDVLYESRHPDELAQGLLKFVTPTGTILLSDPGRAYIDKFLISMKKEGFAGEMDLISIDSKEIFIFKFTACTESQDKVQGPSW